MDDKEYNNIIELFFSKTKKSIKDAGVDEAMNEFCKIFLNLPEKYLYRLLGQDNKVSYNEKEKEVVNTVIPFLFPNQRTHLIELIKLIKNPDVREKLVQQSWKFSYKLLRLYLSVANCNKIKIGIDSLNFPQNLLPKIQGRIPSENIDSLVYYLKRFSPSFPQFNFCEMPYLSKLILYEEISGDTKESYNLLKFLIEDIKIELEPFVFDEKSFIILSDSPFHLCLRNYNEFKKEVLKIYVKNKVDINYTIDGKNTYDYIIQLPSNHKKEILELIKPIYSPPVDTSKNEYENLKAYLDTQIEVQRARLRQHDVLLANISVQMK